MSASNKVCQQSHHNVSRNDIVELMITALICIPFDFREVKVLVLLLSNVSLHIHYNE